MQAFILKTVPYQALGTNFDSTTTIEILDHTAISDLKLYTQLNKYSKTIVNLGSVTFYLQKIVEAEIHQKVIDKK